MAKKMHSSMWVYLTVLLAAMVGLAMTPLANAQDQGAQSQSQMQNQKPITVTGCLQKASSGEGYQLTDSASMKTYDLTAASTDVDLNSNVGHTVTVTGTPAAAASSDANGANPGANPANPSNPGSATPGSSASSASGSQNQQLSVSNVKQVSSTCQGGRL